MCNIWCIGLNYFDYVEEVGLLIFSEFIFFSKFLVIFCEVNVDIFYLFYMIKLDWEVELVFVIGKIVFCVLMEDVLDYVVGYMLVNDVLECIW